MIKGLDFEPTIPQRTFERRPHEWLGQRIEGIEYEVAPLRPVKSPGADAHEVATPHPPIFERRLYRAKEIFVRWRHFKDNRSPTGVGVVHNDVDMILAERILVVHQRGRRWRCLSVRGGRRGEEAFDVFIECLFDFLKVLLDYWVSEGGRRVGHGLLDEWSHERTLERMHCLLCLLLEALDSGEYVTQALTKRRVLGAQVPILFDGEMPSVEPSFEFGQRREAPCEDRGELWHECGIGIVPEQTKMWCQALLKLLQQALLTAA